MTSSYKHTRYIEGLLVSGKLAVAALAGQFVSNKNLAAAAGVVSQHDAAEFELSTGRRAFALLRDVINATEHSLDSMMRQENGHLSPALINQVVTARQLLEGEFEGTDFLVTTGGQALSTATPLRSELTTVGGKLALKTGDQIEKVVTGRNGIGAQALVGARIGDKVRSVYNETDNADVTSSFESTVSVADQVQQSAATDFSAKKLLFIVETPNTLQETVGRLAGFLEPEDGANFRILVEFVA